MTSDDIRKNADLYTKKYNHLVDSKIVDMEPINGVYELFSLGFKSFINSATPEENIKNIISAKGWDVHFTNVYGSPLSKEENFKKCAKSILFIIMKSMLLVMVEMMRNMPFLCPLTSYRLEVIVIQKATIHFH